MKQSNSDGATGYQAKSITVVHQPLRNPSIIAEVVNIIAGLPNADLLICSGNILPAEVQVKIEYNNLQKSKNIIATYKDAAQQLEDILNILEQQKPRSKEKLLAIVKDCYAEQLGIFLNGGAKDIAVIQQASDAILENIRCNLRQRVMESSNLQAFNEDVDLAVRLIIADAFISCIVLENPVGAL
jgi:uncharacterized protein with ACT and thioredoxin-like domain